MQFVLMRHAKFRPSSCLKVLLGRILGINGETNKTAQYEWASKYVFFSVQPERRGLRTKSAACRNHGADGECA